MAEQKKIYIKPELTRVDLVAEEAVLATGCKTNPTLASDCIGGICGTVIVPGVDAGS